MLPPRLIQLTLVFGITLLLIIFNISNSYKWIILSIAQIVSMAIPIPKEDWNAALFQSLIHIPKLTLMTIINILHLKDTPKKFFHTKHGSIFHKVFNLQIFYLIYNFFQHITTYAHTYF